MYITPLFLNIMENESFERAKAIKEEIEKCNSLLESILKSSRECCVYRDADRGTRDLVVIPLPKYCTQYIIDGPVSYTHLTLPTILLV